jgi:hypothetical protein
MKIYPVEPSFSAGGSVELAVQPCRRFSIAIYQQQTDEALTSFSGVAVGDMKDVKATLVNGKYVFESAGDPAPVSFDKDWQWPTITIKPNSPVLESGAYIAVAYEVDPAGEPRSEFGVRCALNKPVFGWPPDSDNMALLIVRPDRPSALLTYVIPTATYQAYNCMGGGSYYDDPVHRTPPVTKVSLRRPGGGLGARLGYPADPYDKRSPRQTFTHWDAKFIRWLRKQNLACDFYTDLDLHRGTDLKLSDYRCMLSVGHHEYWSQEMRDHVAAFIAGGGNLAVFSGNTCFKPIDFGPRQANGDLVEMNRAAEHWPNFNESDLLGLSYGYGGGYWGAWRRLRGGWIQIRRKPIGYTVRQANHWVFAGTDLEDGQTFGAQDHLVGYEADGTPAIDNGFETLAVSSPLVGWDMGGTAAMGMFQPKSVGGHTGGQVFNCGTTDWSRVLMDPEASSHIVVGRITRNVIRTFLHLDAESASRRDAQLQEHAAYELDSNEAVVALRSDEVAGNGLHGSLQQQTP